MNRQLTVHLNSNAREKSKAEVRYAWALWVDERKKGAGRRTCVRCRKVWVSVLTNGADRMGEETHLDERNERQVEKHFDRSESLPVKDE